MLFLLTHMNGEAPHVQLIFLALAAESLGLEVRLLSRCDVQSHTLVYPKHPSS